MKEINNRYQVIRKIGKGGSGNVYLVYDKKIKKNWAMKVMEGTNTSEFEILCRINYPAFPRVVDYISSDGKMYIIMDYVNGIILREYIDTKCVDEEEVRNLGMQIAKAFSYLHNLMPPIYYLDCKPDNILVTEAKQISIVDFGSAYIDNEKNKEQRISGTYFYAPIEQTTCNKNKGFLSKQCDIYSLGMTLYYAMTGKEQVIRDKKGRIHIRHLNSRISYGMNRIIDKCTRMNNKQRYQTMDELLFNLKKIEMVNRQEKRKHYILRLFYIIENVVSFLLAFKIIKYFVLENEWLIAVCCLLLSIILFTEFFRKNNYLWKVKKEVCKGNGKRILFMILLIFLFHQKATIFASHREESLHILLLDKMNRNILIKDGFTWNICENIKLEIPIEELFPGENTIIIMCKGVESNSVKTYELHCEEDVN